MPSCCFQRSVLLLIPCDITVELGLPKLHVGFWHSCKSTSFVSMPEASVYKDDSMPLVKHNIGMSRQFLRVKTITESQRMKMTTHKHFWFSVF